jgi:hypothetical protein
MVIRGCETLPKELGTYMDVQGTQRNTFHHLVSLEFTGIWNLHKRREEEPLHNRTEREENRGGKGAAHREKWRAGTNTGDRRSTVVAGEGRSPAREWESPERQREAEEKCSAQSSGGERFFKNRIWAHRTVHSVCPVHTGQRTVAVWWTTGQRTGKWILSARLPVHRTVHSAVSGAHRTVRWA